MGANQTRGREGRTALERGKKRASCQAPQAPGTPITFGFEKQKNKISRVSTISGLNIWDFKNQSEIARRVRETECPPLKREYNKQPLRNRA